MAQTSAAQGMPKAAKPRNFQPPVSGAAMPKVSDKLVYEINHDIKFIELSVVGDGAFKGCG